MVKCLESSLEHWAIIAQTVYDPWFGTAWAKYWNAQPLKLVNTKNNNTTSLIFRSLVLNLNVIIDS